MQQSMIILFFKFLLLNTEMYYSTSIYKKLQVYKYVFECNEKYYLHLYAAKLYITNILLLCRKQFFFD